jgi:hypothetical protein
VGCSSRPPFQLAPERGEFSRCSALAGLVTQPMTLLESRALGGTGQEVEHLARVMVALRA